MITLNQKYYLYAYGNPDNGEIFYIGKGSGKRHLVHLATAKNGYPKNKNKLFINKIKKILGSGKQPLIHRFMSTNSEAESYQNENQIIKRIGLDNLYNLREGGEGGYSNSKDVKDKISQSLKEYFLHNANPMAGRKLSEETKAKMKESLRKHKPEMIERAKHRKYSTETRKKMSESAKKRKPSFLGNTHSEETKMKISNSKKGIGYKGTDRAKKQSQAIKEWWLNRKALNLDRT